MAHSLLPPSIPSLAVPALRALHLPGTLTAPRSSSLKAFIPSAGDFRPELDDNPEAIISGEWAQNFSFLSYDDLLAYLQSQPTPQKNIGSTTALGEVMSSTVIRTVTREQRVGEIAGHFEFVSGLPVVDGDLRCVGVLSKNDLSRAEKGLNAKVGELMSSPAITLTPEKTVKDAAALMLKKKIHRIPILNKQKQVIGMITRRDIYQALEETFSS